jgi:dipeptidase D
MIRNIEPKALWGYFADLNAVPRPSKKEEKVIQFMLDFGKSLGLETIEDSIHNVIIKKPASKGMENRKTVILQSHLDMVHQKNSDTKFDFDTQGIEMIVEGDWLRANGTTLGADNGIGVASIMAILASSEIAHPAIEAMFTIDEETGMTGAKYIDTHNFTGKILLNLDTEDDDELSIGCAGGIDTNTEFVYNQIDTPNNTTGYEIIIKGLLGGHSGMDIDKGRGNANKLMTRILLGASQKFELYIDAFDGGSLRNAIPREATATCIISNDDKIKFEAYVKDFILTLKQEYASIEKEMTITMDFKANPTKVADRSIGKQILNALYAVPNGVFRMSPDIEGLVEASNSLARVIIKDGKFSTQSLQRSSVESTKDDVANAVRASFEAIGVTVEQSGDYPGWQPNSNSMILKIAADIYRTRFNAEPKIKACHAGLECGILSEKFPKLDMVSFGPNIRAAHSPDEKVQISSVQKYWPFLLEILEKTPMN